MNNDIVDFSILKFFRIKIRHRKGTYTIQVIWKMPKARWVKIDTNRAT